MGWETANIHLGTLRARTILAELKKRPKGWLFQAARQMEKSVMADFADYSAAVVGRLREVSGKWKHLACHRLFKATFRFAERCSVLRLELCNSKDRLTHQ